ncbi:hypothetical protein [Pelosinus sp. sgz500959]|uniref:hypothetical protein n=1 Tax=Pelosinus sp. sgz500959 TaxID=3242472 RepID=UPI00366DDC50
MLIPWEILCEDNEETQNLLEKIVEVAAADPLIFDAVVRGILHQNPYIRIQAAEMAERVTQVRPLFLTPYKRLLLKELAFIEEMEVRQQVALLYGRVFWDEWDLKQVVVLLGEWIEKKQAEQIVNNSLESLHTLAMQKEWISPIYFQHLKNAREETKLPFHDLTIPE